MGTKTWQKERGGTGSHICLSAGGGHQGPQRLLACSDGWQGWLEKESHGGSTEVDLVVVVVLVVHTLCSTYTNMPKTEGEKKMTKTENSLKWLLPWSKHVLYLENKTTLFSCFTMEPALETKHKITCKLFVWKLFLSILKKCIFTVYIVSISLSFDQKSIYINTCKR